MTPVSRPESLTSVAPRELSADDDSATTEWFGPLPGDWESTRVKYLASYINGYGFSTSQWSDQGRRIIRIQNLTGSDDIYNRFDGELPERYLARPGDLLISWSASLGMHEWTHDDSAWVNQHIYKVQPNRRLVVKRYLYWLGTVFMAELEHKMHGSAMQHVTQEKFGSLQVPLPPKKDQEKIAGFLDSRTDQIDDLIAKKERLIELLEEKRTALITQAVTKGLDPDVPMEDSGVEWLGEIPEHWDVASLTHLSPTITVGIVVTPTKYYQAEGVPCLRSQNVHLAEISFENLVFIGEEANEQLEKSQIYSGDLVTVRTGEPGTTAVVPGRLDGANCIDLIIIRQPKNADARWLCWFMNSEAAQVQYRIWSGGAAQQHLNVGAVKRVRVPVPPRDEQEEIQRFLRSERDQFEELRERLQLAIERLQEYRSALITAAVTGKIDVRDHAA